MITHNDLAFELLGLALTHTPAVGPYHTGARMHPNSRFETQPNDRATMKLRAFIADLQLRAQILDTDIHDEEQRTSIFDVANVAYPTLARNLRTRRDNLLATIKVLKSQLAETEMAA